MAERARLKAQLAKSPASRLTGPGPNAGPWHGDWASERMNLAAV